MHCFRILTLAILFSVHANGQSYIKYSVGASLSGNLCQTYLSANARSNYVDSMKSMHTFTPNLGVNLWWHALLGKNLTIQTGIGYLDVGYERNQNNIQYKDALYPGIGNGILMDKSGGSGEKSITYTYHFRYIQIPFLVNYEIYHSRDFFYRLSLTGGGGLSLLINHSLKAQLNNFVVGSNGQDNFSFDSTGYTARRIAFNMMLGAKGEYRYSKNTIIYLMPMVGFYPISITSSDISAYPYYFQLNAGVQFAFGKLEDKKK